MVFPSTFVASWERASDAGIVPCGDISIECVWTERELRTDDREMTCGSMEGAAAKVGSFWVLASHSQHIIGW